MRENQNLIPEVFDPAQGVYIQAKKFFSDNTDLGKDEIHARRRDLLKAKRTGTKLWVCSLCQESVYIAGGLGRTKRRYHFKHFRNNPQCPYQTGKNTPPEVIRKIKYNGAKESDLHRRMKETLANLLAQNPEVSDLLIEKTFFHQDGGKEWRRPDVSFCWRNTQIVFEIQISSDFLDVIVGREEFYRSQGVFIFWIFNRLDSDRFTSRDIYMGNQKNVYVFRVDNWGDGESKGELSLECHYKVPNLSCQSDEEWKCRDVLLDDLTFDNEKMQVYWFSYDKQADLLRRQQLKEDFEDYWCRRRLSMESSERLYWDQQYEEKFFKLLGVPKGWVGGGVQKFLYALYSLRDRKVYEYRLNLFALVDVTLNARKAYSYVLFWAIEVFGHGEEFKARTAFRSKVDRYKENRASDEFKRDTQFDTLFGFLFPELQQKLMLESPERS